MKVSVIIPVFNEQNTVASLLRSVLDVIVPGIEREIIVVDDGSTDETRKILKGFERNCRVIYLEKNMGKGVALRKGFNEAQGDYIVNQDADFEYDPKDLVSLVNPVLSGDSEVVFGSRRLDPTKNKYAYRRYLWGGVALNHMVNKIAGTRINDIFSGSKLFPRSALQKIELKSTGFEIETELTIKLSRAGYHIMEVPISYTARTIEQGKKIRPRDAFRILLTAFRSR